MQRSIRLAFLLVSAIFVFTACNLEQEIEIELPAYQSQYVVECYLEPGQPFTLLLTRSDAYFNPFPIEENQFLENILVEGATVTIKYKDETVVLDNGLFFDPVTLKLFNYGSQVVVPEDYEAVFELSIQTPEGETFTSTTQLLPKVPIDSIVVQFNETDTLARVLTYLTDDRNQSNYYRRMLHQTTLDSIPQQDFPVSDRISESETIVFGTAYDYAVGDTVINSIFHITQEYYDFLISVQGAIGSNGNPFAQPGRILSNVEGASNPLGIFTGIAVDRVQTIIEK